LRSFELPLIQDADPSYKRRHHGGGDGA